MKPTQDKKAILSLEEISDAKADAVDFWIKTKHHLGLSPRDIASSFNSSAVVALMNKFMLKAQITKLENRGYRKEE